MLPEATVVAGRLCSAFHLPNQRCSDRRLMAAEVQSLPQYRSHSVWVPPDVLRGLLAAQAVAQEQKGRTVLIGAWGVWVYLQWPYSGER